MAVPRAHPEGGMDAATVVPRRDARAIIPDGERDSRP
jgi:hypothetical protein